MKIRPNYAEGLFYAATTQEMIHQIDAAVEQEMKQIDYGLAAHNIVGGVVPHAGHQYAAPQAVHFFEILKRSGITYDVVVLINPNHHGSGLPVSIDVYDAWQSAFGVTEIDRELADRTGIPTDNLSQKYEHSGEVILPYIQYYMGTGVKLLPISFGAQSGTNAKILGELLATACDALGRKALVIASSDFNHFSSPEKGKELDDYALEALLNRDCQSFEDRILESNISICGYGAILALYFYAQQRFGDFKMRILRQGHSGEVHPDDKVVDYISMLFYTE